MADKNHEWLLIKRPEGVPQKGRDYEWRETEMPQPEEGQMLVKTLYAAMDPAIRGWMDPSGNYMDPIPLGTPVRSVVLGKVVESNQGDFPEGTIVSGMGSWSEYFIAPSGTVGPVPVEWGHDLTTYLHPLGAVGATAYYGLFEIGEFKDGENLLVSGAAGGVGSLVGQFGKIKGGKVVGIAGGTEKCKYLTEELGFDGAIDYKATDDLSAEIGKHFPDGFDVYFENVGGKVLEAAMDNMALGARIAVCGMISEYNATKPEPGPHNMWNLLVKRARIQGLLVADYFPRAMEGYSQINEWIKDGLVKFKVDVRDGLENAPDVFTLLFTGEHDGKLLLKIADE
ncbi:MAG: NADP-dependent oxidoreductase [Alphaproteobacteria bacterium]|nr:NADP-dependent oxidoreductase [Alphaproteobacteria bacterium]